MFIALGAAGLSLAAPSFAAEPQLMSVTNLDVGDHLNVRAAATARSDDLGDLKSGDIVEVISTSEDGKWAQFIWQEGDGWAAARYLTDEPRAVLRNGLPTGLTCSGTEPFWSAAIGQGGAFEFKPYEGDAVMAPSTSAKVDQGYEIKAGGISANLSAKACTDGATDRSYGWQLDLKLENGFDLTGCCTAQTVMR